MTAEEMVKKIVVDEIVKMEKRINKSIDEKIPISNDDITSPGMEAAREMLYLIQTIETDDIRNHLITLLDKKMSFESDINEQIKPDKKKYPSDNLNIITEVSAEMVFEQLMLYQGKSILISVIVDNISQLPGMDKYDKKDIRHTIPSRKKAVINRLKRLNLTLKTKERGIFLKWRIPSTGKKVEDTTNDDHLPENSSYIHSADKSVFDKGE